VSDCGDDVYIGALPRGRRGGKADDALAAIERFHPAPTIVVDTGGGFHVWWAIDSEPAAAPIRSSSRGCRRTPIARGRARRRATKEG
jgi:hypothetical protein